MTETPFDPDAEFDRQVGTLLEKDYPTVSGQPKKAFLAVIEPLRDIVLARSPLNPPTRSRIPFVLVIDKKLAPTHRLMPLAALNGKAGFADFAPDDLGRFVPISDVQIPDSPAYVVFDVSRGSEFVNVTPDKAHVEITAQRRTPLTVSEGIALITHFPEALEKNNCFSLIASRCGDKRVPALWISKGAPKLGWCWAGNPHTWLGSAHCGDRMGNGRERRTRGSGTSDSRSGTSDSLVRLWCPPA